MTQGPFQPRPNLIIANKDEEMVNNFSERFDKLIHFIVVYTLMN